MGKYFLFSELQRMFVPLAALSGSVAGLAPSRNLVLALCKHLRAGCAQKPEGSDEDEGYVSG